MFNVAVHDILNVFLFFTENKVWLSIQIASDYEYLSKWTIHHENMPI